jgi:hypothetical protein
MANTLKFGNGQWATGNGTALAYNDENANFKPLPFDFTRASSGTVVNQSGLIETVGSGIPRIDFLGNTKGSLLLEPSRTNSFLHSNQFDTTWQPNYLVLTSGQIGVGGSQNAWLLTGSTGTDEKRLRQSVTPTGNVACSVYAKKGTNDFVWLRGVTAATNIRTFFNLSNGTIGSDASVSSSMIDMGNGWYRCEAVFNQDAGFEFYIGLSDSDGSAVTSTTGNIYIQYSQLESGSYATSYIPTSGSAVTRVAETNSQTPPSSVIGQTEGTMFVDCKVNAQGTYTGFSLNDNTTNNEVIIRFTTQDRIEYYLRSGGSQPIGGGTTLFDTDKRVKIAFAYKSGDSSVYINGAQVTTSTTTTMPVNLSIIKFARGNSTADFSGKTNDFKVYNTRLSNAELAALTQV